MHNPIPSDFESDAFLSLLSDALRSGPGSLAWTAAVEKLRAMHSTEADEYKMILNARENLAKGREYREIRPGPGFTQKVMDGIENENADNPARNGPTTPVIVFLAAVLIIAAVLLVAFLLGRQSPPDDEAGRLMGQSFSTTVINADLTHPFNTDFEAFGRKPVPSSLGAGLRAADPENSPDFITGGIRLAKPLGPTEIFAFEVGLQLRKPEGNPNLRAQVFLADASDKELVVEFFQGRFVVYRDGVVAGEAKGLANRNTRLIKTSPKYVDVQINGHSVYAGVHGLGESPRSPGVRFFSKGNPNWALEELAIPTIRVLKP